MFDILPVLASGLVGGLLVAGSRSMLGPLAVLAGLPASALVVGSIAAPVFVVAMRDWRVGLLAFAVWLPFEDLARKYAGNDLRLFIIKDLLFLLAMIGVGRQLVAVRAWRNSLQEVRPAFLALLAWSLLMTIPALLTDWRLPLLGLKFYFLYAPLVGVGYLLTRNLRLLRKAMIILAVLAVVPTVLGIAQAIVGPSFLAPGRETPFLRLELVRNGDVFRPTGTFVNSGRYASVVLVGLALALAAFGLPATRRASRALIALAVAVGMVGLIASGVRSVILLGLVMLVFVLLRTVGTASVVVLSIAVIGLGSFAVAFPDTYQSRIRFFETLKPNGSDNEWVVRWDNATTNVVRGIRVGGVIGRGTGTQSSGQVYLYGSAEGDPTNDVNYLRRNSRYVVESGYGSVAFEMGVVGLALWLWWSLTWWRRLCRCARSAGRYFLVARGLLVWCFLHLFVNFALGVQTFQDYIPNGYFWLFSGILFGLARPADVAVAAQPPSPGPPTMLSSVSWKVRDGIVTPAIRSQPSAPSDPNYDLDRTGATKMMFGTGTQERWMRWPEL